MLALYAAGLGPAWRHHAGGHLPQSVFLGLYGPVIDLFHLEQGQCIDFITPVPVMVLGGIADALMPASLLVWPLYWIQRLGKSGPAHPF